MITIEQTFDADPRAIQQINFTANLNRAGNTTLFFIIKEAKETVLRLLTRSCKSIVNVFYKNLIFNDIK